MEKRMISKKGCRIMLAAAAVLAVMAAFITYQVGVVYGTEPLPLDLAVQKAFFSLRSQILNPIITYFLINEQAFVAKYVHS